MFNDLSARRLALRLAKGIAFAQSPALQDGFLDVPGAKIHYKDSGGRGVPVIFLHAFTGSTEVWEHQIPAFTRAGYRFIAYERRGIWTHCGRREWSRIHRPDDLLALADHFQSSTSFTSGTAGGGFVAVDFAIAYPQRLRSLTLLCSQGGIQDPDYLATIKRLTPGGFANMPESFRELSPSYRASNPEGVARWTESRSTTALPKPCAVPRSLPRTKSCWRHSKESSCPC